MLQARAEPGTQTLVLPSQPDLAWRKYTAGENIIWLMNGLTMARTVALPAVKDAKWTIEAAGDFNGDSKADSNFVQYFDWVHGKDPSNPADSKQPLDAGHDTNWQVVDPVGYDTKELMSTDELSMLNMESTTLAPGGGGYNAYDPSGFSFLHTMSGRAVLRYPQRAQSSAMFQFKKQDLEKQVVGGRA